MEPTIYGHALDPCEGYWIDDVKNTRLIGDPDDDSAVLSHRNIVGITGERDFFK